MAGLIQARLSGDTHTAAGYDPEELSLNEDEDTVEGRVARIIKNDSPLQQLARTSAAQVANRRGVMNSAMAVSAGERAVIESALPIAQQDAQTSIQVRLANNANQIQAAQFNATGINQLKGITAQADANSRLQKERGDIDLQLATADAAMRERLLVRQGEIDAQLRANDNAAQMERQKQAQTYETGALEQRANIDSRLQSERAAQDLTRQEAAFQQERQLTEQRAILETQLQELRGEQSMSLADLEFQHRNVLQASTNVAGYMAEFTNSLSQIMASDVPLAQKQQLIDQQMKIGETNLALMSAIHNLDLRGVLIPAPNTGSNTSTPTTPYYPIPFYIPGLTG